MTKATAAGWAHLVPPHLAVFCENMQGIHSIEYYALTSPIYILAVFDCQVG